MSQASPNTSSSTYRSRSPPPATIGFRTKALQTKSSKIASAVRTHPIARPKKAPAPLDYWKDERRDILTAELLERLPEENPRHQSHAFQLREKVAASKLTKNILGEGDTSALTETRMKWCVEALLRSVRCTSMKDGPADSYALSP